MIEGIEDLDYKTPTGLSEAIQYKYYSSKSATPSTLRDAILPMLTDFKARKKNKQPLINYKIYGYFKLPLSSDVDEKFINSSLVKGGDAPRDYKKELNLSDALIEEFLLHFKIVCGEEFESQNKQLLESIANRFSCTIPEADILYYPRALSLINKIAINQEEKDRTVSCETFFNDLDQKVTLFNIWLSEYKGKRKHLTEISNFYFKKKSLDYHQRFFVFDCTGIEENKIFEIVEKTSKAFYKKQSSRVTSPSPHITLYGSTDELIAKIKNSFRDIGYRFVDGYSFKGATFRLSDLCVECNLKNDIAIKFVDSIEKINDVVGYYSEIKELYIISGFGASEQLAKNINLPVKKIELSSVTDATLLY
ncbi:hypothetical protein DBB_42420 [Desulfoluna spongiiphila]|nr:hypothetical protein DBB_42420 [Desulfoluna spongiiphila]